jgi:hypothetical protein
MHLCLFGPPAEAGEKAGIDADADKILRQMCDYLGSLQEFQFHVENSLETVLPCNQKIHIGRAVDVFVKRPDRLRANIEGDLSSKNLYYDGRSITLLSKDLNFYATLDAPATIEEALDYALESYGLMAPMHELLYSKPYDLLLEDTYSGTYIGQSKVFGVECHHLAFQGEQNDWQLWIAKGDTPLPRKLVITSKWITGAPQFMGFVSDWKTSATFDEGLFSFAPPDKAEQIDFLPLEGEKVNKH